MTISLASVFRIARNKGSATFFVLIRNQYLHPLVRDHPDISIPLPPAISILFPHIPSDQREGLQV
jgi:hypothetical protein